jgi:hypothetical protein
MVGSSSTSRWPGQWLDEAIIDEVAMEEVLGGGGFRTLRRLLAGWWLGSWPGWRGSEAHEGIA